MPSVFLSTGEEAVEVEGVRQAVEEELKGREVLCVALEGVGFPGQGKGRGVMMHGAGLVWGR